MKSNRRREIISRIVRHKLVKEPEAKLRERKIGRLRTRTTRYVKRRGRRKLAHQELV
jgi:hypothetical protein